MENAFKYTLFFKKFISPRQLINFQKLVLTENKGFFFSKLEEFANRIEKMPKTYEQDGLGEDAMVFLHYFKKNAHYYIMEKDMEEEQLQAFGWADCGLGFPELGYISIVELLNNGFELDFDFQPKKLKDIKEAE